jgi:PhzF family phenazine biosynthesis protein
MKFPIYQVDAFTNQLFGGNPAAVCPLTEWLPDNILQALAAENNLSETAFIVQEKDEHHIRWFTPTTEVALCGHATLAAAHVYFTEWNDQYHVIRFKSKSGPLHVRKSDNWLQLDFPSFTPTKVDSPPMEILSGLGVSDAPVFTALEDYMVVVQSEAILLSIRPDFKKLATVKARGVIVTAPAETPDFVSRCFYPQSGIDEDPVTGSAHSCLTPYWAERLGKTVLTARQLSKRQGYLKCELSGGRVLMSGQAVTYLKGYYEVPFHEIKETIKPD